MDDEFIIRLALPRPDPGGGGAAAHCALVALALLEKIIRLEVRRSANLPDLLSFWNGLADVARCYSEKLLELRDEDSRAYLQLSRARASRDKSTLRAASLHATECPMKIVEEIGSVLQLAAEAGARCRKHLLSDLLVSVELLKGAGEAASHIARENIRFLPEEDAARLSQRLTKTLDELRRHFMSAAPITDRTG